MIETISCSARFSFLSFLFPSSLSVTWHFIIISTVVDNQSIFNHSWISNITGISRGRFSINQNNRFSSASRASHHTPKTGAQERFNTLVLMEILRKTDSLLDVGEVRVQDYSKTMPSCISDSDFFAGRKLHVGKIGTLRSETRWL